MARLEPGVGAAPGAAPRIGRVGGPGVGPEVGHAIDRLLAAAEIDVVEVELAGFGAAADAGRTVLLAEGTQVNGHLYEADPESVGADLRERFELARLITPDELEAARAAAAPWRDRKSTRLNSSH